MNASREGWLAPAQDSFPINIELILNLERGQATLPDLQMYSVELFR